MAAQLKRVVDGRSVRSLAEQTGWGRSTIHEWLTGSRPPTPSQLDDSMDAVQVPPEARRELHRIRDSAGSPQVDQPVPPPLPEKLVQADIHSELPSEKRPDNPAIPVRATRRLKLIRVIVAATVALALSGGGYLVGRTTPPGRGVSAKVENTFGRGVFTRNGPSKQTTKMNSLFDGDRVYVVCLAENGSPVTDDAQRKTRTVWALLSTGVWVSDLYLNTPKNWVPPQAPPAPLRSC